MVPKEIKGELFSRYDIFFEEGVRYDDLGWDVRLYAQIQNISVYDNEFYRYRKRAGSVTTQISDRNIENHKYAILTNCKYVQNLENGALREVLTKYLVADRYRGLLFYLIGHKALGRYFEEVKEYQSILDHSITKKGILFNRIRRVTGLYLAVWLVKSFRFLYRLMKRVKHHLAERTNTLGI